MESKFSLLFSNESGNRPYPKQTESGPHIFMIPFNIILISTPTFS